jgi:Tfp pilus assembly protein PilO
VNLKMNINFQSLIVQILQDKKKLALAIMVIVFALYVDLNFILKAQTKAIKSFNHKINQLKNDINSYNLDMNMMQRSGGKPLSTRPKRLLAEGEISWLIEEIYKTSNLYNLKIQQVRPTQAIQHSAAQAKRYLSIPINIDLYGGYHALVGFIRSLEAQAVIIAVDELEIRRSRKDIFSHEVKLKLNTYVSPE